jgi:hypothetical protein
MSTVLGILGFGALFALFGLLAPMLRGKSCGGDSCGSCGVGTECKYTE